MLPRYCDHIAFPNKQGYTVKDVPKTRNGKIKNGNKT